MKNTPLTDRHIALGARMAEFAGFNMPISYAGIKEEHQAVRERAGIFDVSHMGEFIVRGREALDFVQYVTSNDVSRLEIGDAQYSCFPTPEGGIVDDLIVYRLPEDNCSEGEQAFMLVVNGANVEKDWNWLQQHHKFDTRLINISDETGLVAVQGPQATRILQKLTDIDLSAIKFYTFTKGTFAGHDNVLISATGYTGSGGFELYATNEQIGPIWDAVLEAGKEIDLQPTGLGARDTLRLEMGYCLYGNDITDETSALEAGLGWITKLRKGDFVGRDFLLAQKEAGLQRRLVAFKLEDRRVPRHGYPIENEAGEVIGEVTSGTQAPSVGCPIGMGYVPFDQREPGTVIYISFGKKRLPATISKLPFYQPQ
jgi:aminomethyltransferase